MVTGFPRKGVYIAWPGQDRRKLSEKAKQKKGGPMYTPLFHALARKQNKQQKPPPPSPGRHLFAPLQPRSPPEEEVVTIYARETNIALFICPTFITETTTISINIFSRDNTPAPCQLLTSHHTAPKTWLRNFVVLNPTQTENHNPKQRTRGGGYLPRIPVDVRRSIPELVQGRLKNLERDTSDTRQSFRVLRRQRVVHVRLLTRLHHPVYLR